MARYNSSNYQSQQLTFTGGELSPHLQTRTDLQQYDKTAQILKNVVVRAQGDVLKRSGTAFVSEIKSSAADARLIRFVYSNTDAYVLEMGAGYFRFYHDNAQLLSSIPTQVVVYNAILASAITGWTTNSSGTGTAAWNSGNGGALQVAGGAAGVGSAYMSLTHPGTSQHTLRFTTYTNNLVYKIGTTIGGSELGTATVAPGAHVVNFTDTNVFAGPIDTQPIYIQFSNANNNNAEVNTISVDSVVYQINNPYTQNQLNDVKFAQSYDTIYFVHPSWPPFLLQRTAHNKWGASFLQTAASTLSLQPHAFTSNEMVANMLSDGPYYDQTDKQYGGLGTDITISSSASAPGSVTLTASAAVFVAADVGRFIRRRGANTGKWGWAVITAFTSSTVVTAQVVSHTTIVGTTVTNDVGFDAITASRYWRLGHWSDTTGWPSTIYIYQQRLIFASNTSKQQTIWMSVAGDLYNMRPDDDAYNDNVTALSAITYTIADNKANVILWMLARKFLFVGTSGGVWAVNTQDSASAISASNITIVPVIQEASSTYPPLAARTAILYLQRFGTKVLEIGYKFQDDNFGTVDLAGLSEHLTQEGLTWLTAQDQPNYLVWAVDSIGSLYSFTYVREQNVLAWCRHEIGGDDVVVKSITSIPGDNEDDVWMIVSRTINGATKQYIEYLTPTFIEQDIEDAVFLDSSITYSGAATTTLTGLTHLIGQTVECFGDGAVVTVSGVVSGGGGITLATAVSDAVVGLPYETIIKTNPLVPPSLSNVFPQSERGRAYELILQVYRSYGGQIGQDENHLNDIAMLSGETVMDDPLTLRSGIYRYVIPGNIKLLPTVYIKHTDPVPFNLIGLIVNSVFESRS